MAGGHKVIFLGPGTLQLSENGNVYEVGDAVTVPDDQRVSLTMAGMRFGAVPDDPEPEPAPDPPPPLEPAEVSKAAVEAKRSGRAATSTQGWTPASANDAAPKEGS